MPLEDVHDVGEEFEVDAVKVCEIELDSDDGQCQCTHNLHRHQIYQC